MNIGSNIRTAALLAYCCVVAMACLGCKAGPVWDLTSVLSEAQLAVNSQVYSLLPPDECDNENEFDELAHSLAVKGSPDAVKRLRALEHGGGRERQAAAGRAFVFMAQRSIALGNYDLAAENALHVYLSGVPHRLRLEALRAYCRSADLLASARWIERIETGKQDAFFEPALQDLKALRHLRIDET